MAVWAELVLIQVQFSKTCFIFIFLFSKLNLFTIIDCFLKLCVRAWLKVYGNNLFSRCLYRTHPSWATSRASWRGLSASNFCLHFKLPACHSIGPLQPRALLSCRACCWGYSLTLFLRYQLELLTLYLATIELPLPTIVIEIAQWKISVVAISIKCYN